jgi:hypothetical protein
LSEEEKKTLYELINKGWQYGKYFYDNKPNTPLEYDKFVELGNEMVRAQKKGSKEQIFIKRMIEAVKQYCDSEWDKEGEQMRL